MSLPRVGWMISEGPFQPKPSYDLWQALASEQEEVASQGLVLRPVLLDHEAHTHATAPSDPTGVVALPSSGRCWSCGIFLKGKGVFSLHGSLVTLTFKNKRRLQHSPAPGVSPKCKTSPQGTSGLCFSYQGTTLRPFHHLYSALLLKMI